MTIFTGLWNNVHSQQYSLINQQPAVERDIARQLRKPGGRALKGLMRALNGTAVGGATAAETYRRVVAVSGIGSYTNLGGIRSIQAVSDVNRTTVTADKTRIDALIDGVFAPATYPVDRSGNGGGSKAGRI